MRQNPCDNFPYSFKPSGWGSTKRRLTMRQNPCDNFPYSFKGAPSARRA